MALTVWQWARSAVIAGGPTAADALRRRSMVSVGLPFLRGGIVPTGSNLDSKIERLYADGLYAVELAGGPPPTGNLLVMDRKLFRGVFRRVHGRVN